jgi:hypothetical protein
MRPMARIGQRIGCKIMKTDKIREALYDLQRQRELIDSAIQSLQAVLVRLNGHSDSQGQMPFVSEKKLPGTEMSYVDLAVQLLGTARRPMHIRHLLDQIRILRENPAIKRQSVEATLLRHIQMKGSEARIKKVAAATFALPPDRPTVTE